MVNLSTNFYLKKHASAEHNSLHIGQIPNGQERKFKSNFQMKTLLILTENNWNIYDEYKQKYTYHEFLDRIRINLPFVHPNTTEEIEIREWV